MVGQFTSELLVDNAKVSAQFIVFKRRECLLLYSTAIDLGVLHVGAAPTPVAENCNNCLGRLRGKPQG